MTPGLRSGALACCLVAVTQPAVWARALAGYEGDDFWTLGPLERLGLAFLALCFIAAVLAGAGRLSRRIADQGRGCPIRLATDAALKSAAFGALLWASPQMFYLYYRAIIPGLPLQWVLRAPDIERSLGALTFAHGGRAAEHLSATVFWGLVLQAVWAQTRGRWRIALSLAVIAGPAALRGLSDV